MDLDDPSFLNDTPTSGPHLADKASPTAQAAPQTSHDATVISDSVSFSRIASYVSSDTSQLDQDATVVGDDIADTARDAARLAEQIPEPQIESSRTESIRVEAGERTAHDDNVGDVRHDIGQSVDKTESSKPEGRDDHGNQTPNHSDEEDENDDGTEEGESKGSVDHTTEEHEGDDEKETNIPDKRTGRSLRIRNPPKRLGHTPDEKAKHVEEEEPAVYNALALVSPRKQKALTTLIEGRQKKELSVLGQPVTKAFYKDLYKPRSFVSTTQMEAMLAVIWARRGDILLSNRVAIMDASFVNYLVQEHNRFLRVKNPPMPYPWSRPMQNCVAGIVPNRNGRLRWLVDVDYLYAVMNWETKHWVSLSINLQNGSVNIMDCNQALHAERKLPKLMKPVMEILPLLLRDLVDRTIDKPESFDFCRDIGLPQTDKAGDCGPISAKFIELNSQSLPIDDLTDADIENLRMKYAVDVYEENQEPL